MLKGFNYISTHLLMTVFLLNCRQGIIINLVKITLFELQKVVRRPMTILIQISTTQPFPPPSLTPISILYYKGVSTLRKFLKYCSPHLTSSTPIPITRILHNPVSLLYWLALVFTWRFHFEGFLLVICSWIRMFKQVELILGAPTMNL